MMSPSAMRCAEAARFRPVPAVMRQYSKVRPRPSSSRRSRSTSSALVAPGPQAAKVASMEATTLSDASRSRASSAGLLRARSRSSAWPTSTSAQLGSPSRSTAAASEGRKAGSIPTRRSGTPRPRRWASAFSTASVVVPETVLHRRRPEAAELVLVLLQPVRDVGGEVRPAPDVHHHRQVAAEADGVAVVEEREGVAAQHVLRGLPGGGDHRVHVGLASSASRRAVSKGGTPGDDALVAGLGRGVAAARFCGLVMTVMAFLPGCPLRSAAALRRTWR